MKKAIKEKVADNLDLPYDVVLNIPKLSISGNRELYIENYHSLIEYTDKLIRIKTADYILKIDGAELEIDFINRFDVKIFGIFFKITFDH